MEREPLLAKIRELLHTLNGMWIVAYGRATSYKEVGD
jgi:hypothetical protein